MGNKFKRLVIFVYILTCFCRTSADTYSAQVMTEEHVNLVDTKFLSFTIDTKYLFSSSEKYKSKDCACMATSLTPAYLRIAGASTSRTTFEETVITIDDSEPTSLRNRRDSNHYDSTNSKTKLTAPHSQWQKFVHWAKSTGFDLVFALNSDEKTASGMWDPNTALNMLTAADKANIGDIFWQLGYECTNQSIEEYLNDLETLRVIIETFPSGKAARWRVVGGDVTNCLQTDSKSDFKDYVTLSNDMMDAILLNGNSSSQELERMSERDRYRLLKLLSTSDTPLWLTERSPVMSELDRAADWMTSLGYSARNGFSVHYRELLEEELYEPSLSFYMALLFKNLVGERVLNVDIEASQAILFAHCTSLRHKPVSGAVTFFGANMDEEPARFSIKMSKKEEGGDIMQFILGKDRKGNIVVNGRPMYYEGDIRPTVKRVRPYKTLLINLPPKSFGFWVLANTQIEACYDLDYNNNVDKPIDTGSVNSDDNRKDDNVTKTKRSPKRTAREVFNMTGFEEFIDGSEENLLGDQNKGLKERIHHINNNLKNAQKIFLLNTNEATIKRFRRQKLEVENEDQKKKSLKYKSKLRNDDDSIRNNRFQKFSKHFKNHVPRLKTDKINRARYFKKKSKKNLKGNLKDETISSFQKGDNKQTKLESNPVSLKNIETKRKDLAGNSLVRERRNINAKNKLKYEKESSENEIDVDGKDKLKLGKILHKLKKLSESPLQIKEQDNNDYEEQDSAEGIVLKTKVSGDSAVIDISEKSHTGLLKSTLEDILSLLADFNKNINRFWAAITILD